MLTCIGDPSMVSKWMFKGHGLEPEGVGEIQPSAKAKLGYQPITGLRIGVTILMVGSKKLNPSNSRRLSE